MSLNAKGSWSTLEGDIDGLKILESEDQLIIGLDFGTTFRYVLIVSTQGFLLKMAAVSLMLSQTQTSLN